VEFYPGAFDASNPRKGGQFPLVPADHDVTDELAAYKLASLPFPGCFGLLYRVQRPTKNAAEAKINADAQSRVAGLTGWQLLARTFDRMK